MTDLPTTLLVSGAPGSGKSTHAGRLAERLGAAHVNPGALLRQAAAQDSPRAERLGELMAEGRLVPDELIETLVRERLEALAPRQRVVLDGYPRTAAQAETLRRVLAELGRLEPRPLVLRLDVPRDVLAERLRERREREGRRDDTDAAIARRLASHDTLTAATQQALGGWTDVVPIGGDQPIEAVGEQIDERLEARS